MTKQTARYKSHSSVPKRIVIVIISFITILLFVVFLLIIFSGEIRNVDTIYTPQFSIQKFQSVSTNMTKDEVIQTLGEPLSKTQGWPGMPSNESWQYSIPGKLHINSLDDFFGGNYYKVLFDKNGKVTYTTYNVF